MLHHRLYEAGDLFGFLYDLPSRGDGIPMHHHLDPADHHTTVVLRGSCICYGPAKAWHVILKAGDPPYDFPAERQHHEIVALEPDTRLLSLNKLGRPADLVLAPEDYAGTVMRPITMPEAIL